MTEHDHARALRIFFRQKIASSLRGNAEDRKEPFRDSGHSNVDWLVSVVAQNEIRFGHGRHRRESGGVLFELLKILIGSLQKAQPSLLIRAPNPDQLIGIRVAKRHDTVA